MGVDALDIGIKLKILKKQGKPSTQRNQRHRLLMTDSRQV